MIDCLKWLLNISLNNIIFTVLERTFSKKRSSRNQYNFGIWEFYAYAMHYFLDMLREVNTKTLWLNWQLKLKISYSVVCFTCQLIGVWVPRNYQIKRAFAPSSRNPITIIKASTCRKRSRWAKKQKCGLPSRNV